LPDDVLEIFQKKLLNWFKNNKRRFPWRINSNPYDLIIAEIMLQKTNAEKVEKIYPNFLKKFPNFDTLLNASNEEIKSKLKYLGLQNYKTLVIKELSRNVIEKYDNKIPERKKDLLQIKGIGEYIANAVLCFSFNKRVPIIDSNMIRILERIFNIKSIKKIPRMDKTVWKQMERLLPLNNYKDFNYALLDFASLICKYPTPKCEKCFFMEYCYYYKTNIINNGKKK